MDFINAQDVWFTYAEPDDEAPDAPLPQVLKGVSLSIQKGEFVALLGHNGSGKSTMAKMFNAMLTPTAGRVLVDGMDTKDPAHTLDIRRRVGMVQQNPDNQLVASIVEEDVAFGPENLGVEPAEIRRRVDEALKTVDMYDYRTPPRRRISSPAARNSASRSPASSRCRPNASCSTSPLRCSTRAAARKSWTRSTA